MIRDRGSIFSDKKRGGRKQLPQGSQPKSSEHTDWESVLSRFSPHDTFTFARALEGGLVFGEIGAGKTTGSVENLSENSTRTRRKP